MELGKARSTEEIIKDIKSTLETKVKDEPEGLVVDETGECESCQ